MKEHFKELLEKAIPIAQEKLKEIKGKSYYSEYREGDLLAAFMEQEIGTVEEPYTEPSITLNMHLIVERDMYKLKEDFKFIRIAHGGIPVFEKKSVVIKELDKLMEVTNNTIKKATTKDFINLCGEFYKGLEGFKRKFERIEKNEKSSN